VWRGGGRRRVHSTALDRLVKLVAHLRSPKGCPWDRKQTHLSLIQFLREESRELEKALRRGKPHEIEDELGDLLLQILLHARIAEERGLFDIQDVALSQHRKLVRRHPHVFGRRKLRTAGEVLDSWDEIKREERSQRHKDLQRRLRAV
jgi:tetrapyrrole methylase family protein/MazG family protein